MQQKKGLKAKRYLDTATEELFLGNDDFIKSSQVIHGIMSRRTEDKISK